MLKKTIFKSTHTEFGSCLAQAFHDCPFDANKMENATKLKILSQNYEKNQSNTRSIKIPQNLMVDGFGGVLVYVFVESGGGGVRWWWRLMVVALGGCRGVSCDWFIVRRGL